MDDVGFIAAGYLIAAAAIGGYIASLFARARRARARSAAIVAARGTAGGSSG